MKNAASVSSRPASIRQPVLMIVLCGFSMALGWRIRGQFGHEIGAAIAGAMGAMAVVLCSGRKDWQHRTLCFALLGGLGWGFGGSISYMKVVGYTESSQSETVLYGFAGLFLIGFLWASLGAAGTAIAAVWSIEQLQSLLRVLAFLFVSWFVQDVTLDILHVYGIEAWNWYDTDWISAAVALAVAGVTLCCRGRNDVGARFVVYLSAGWWIAFLGLVVLAGIRLNPPRGDNWAACVGVATAMYVFCYRNQFYLVCRAASVTGIIGAVLFCCGQMAKLGFIATGKEFGWHAVMEFIHGGFLGIALAVGMITMTLQERVDRNSRIAGAWPAWCGTFSLWFLLWVIPYLNLRKSPERWAREFPAFPESFYGLNAVSSFRPSRGYVGWIEILFLVWGVILVWLLCQRRKTPLLIIPPSDAGKAQLLYLVFVWLFTGISFTSEIAGMSPQHFTIQWGITLNAVLCTGLTLCVSGRVGESSSSIEQTADSSDESACWQQETASLKRILVAGLLAFLLTSTIGWQWKRLLFGDKYTGYFPNNHLRFGPDNTNHLK